jgi:hypothetical protein
MRHFGVLAAVLVALPFPAFAESGVWVADEQFAQINVACKRLYRCTTGQDILHDSNTVVRVTPPESVWGVCSAGGGPADSCNECLTNPPTTLCEWHVVPKT